MPHCRGGSTAIAFVFCSVETLGLTKGKVESDMGGSSSSSVGHTDFHTSVPESHLFGHFRNGKHGVRWNEKEVKV